MVGSLLLTETMTSMFENLMEKNAIYKNMGIVNEEKENLRIKKEFAR